MTSPLKEGYQMAVRHFKERLELGQSFEDAVKGMESIIKDYE